jgi:hypothetical protein
MGRAQALALGGIVVTALETARRYVALYQRWIAADLETLQEAQAAAERCQKVGPAEAEAVHRETARLCKELVEVQRRILAHWQVQFDRCQRIAGRRDKVEELPSA